MEKKKALGGKIRPWDRLQEVLPPLSTYEFEELKNSIEQYGILQKILLLPDGRIIDGYHRWKIVNGKVPRGACEILDIGEDSAFALGVLLNIARRNMAPEQIREARKCVKKLALALRKTGKSQPEVAKMLKIPRPTIAYWEAEEKGDISNVEPNNTYIPDLRISGGRTKPRDAKAKPSKRVHGTLHNSPCHVFVRCAGEPKAQPEVKPSLLPPVYQM
jgi:hypothetical protein